MTDVAAYRAVQPAPYSSLSRYTDGGTEWLRIRMQDAIESVYSIRYNGELVDTIEVDSLRDVRIDVTGRGEFESLAVLAARVPRANQRYLTPIGFGASTTIADPITEAIQRMIRYLLRKPNSDPWSPGGGNLLNLRSQLFESEEDLASAVDRAVYRFNKHSHSAVTGNQPTVVKVDAVRVRKLPASEVREALGDTQVASIDDANTILLIQLRSRLRVPRSNSVVLASVLQV